MKAAVVTVSDGVSEGTREDESGEVLAQLLAGEGFEVERRVVPDERDAIADAIVELAEEVVVVLTTGGTGLGPRDCTPEATIDVLEREAPGIAEAREIFERLDATVWLERVARVVPIGSDTVSAL